MSKIFDIVRTISAFAILSKLLGVPFVSQHFWWFTCTLFIGLIGSPICYRLSKKRKKTNNHISEPNEK